jgi:hypothetical protein
MSVYRRLLTDATDEILSCCTQMDDVSDFEERARLSVPQTKGNLAERCTPVCASRTWAKKTDTVFCGEVREPAANNSQPQDFQAHLVKSEAADFIHDADEPFEQRHPISPNDDR